jgi:hypothetical protein
MGKIVLTPDFHDKMMKNLYYRDKYETLIKSHYHSERTDDELKTIAKDLYNQKIFSSANIHKHSLHLINSIFMVLMFLSPKITWEDNLRMNKLIHIYLASLEEDYAKRYDEFINDIGFVYEYLDKATTTGINGYPIFYSCGILNKKDTERMWEFYEKYKELQENLENSF